MGLWLSTAGLVPRLQVLPISFFERSGNAYYNSVAIIDADGSVLGVYRKSHIPDSPGYMEKFYFTPGDTGFKVWDTKYARIGVAICWDQVRLLLRRDVLNCPVELLAVM